MKKRIFLASLVLACQLAPAQVTSASDVSQLVSLLRDGNRGDDAASLRAARIQLAQSSPVAALTRIAHLVRRGHLPARAVLTEGLATRNFAMPAAEAQAFVDEYAAAAAHGDGFGALMQGLFAEYGFGPVQQDAAKAKIHYEAAAHGGNLWALTRLGLMLEQGRDPAVPVDLGRAAFWYDQVSGVDAEATAHIVAMYRSGRLWPGHEPRTEADLAGLEAQQRAWDAAHAVGP